MLVFGTQMHIVTFVLVCLEVILLFLLLLDRIIRPDNRTTIFNIILVAILITYNITGGLLPDPNLPGSIFLQNCIAYGTGFLGPTYFPFYVYAAFDLNEMKFHVVKGVSIFLVVPYILFVAVYSITGQIHAAQYLLIIPVFYAIWVIVSLVKSINVKYDNKTSSHATIEIVILVLSLSPWVFLPIIDILNAGQAMEVLTMNSGFLLLLSFQIKQNFELIRNYLTIHNKEKTLPPNGNGKLFLDTYNLTKREKEVVALIAHGNTYKQIAETLYISERTVKKHIEHIFEKVKVNSKFELISKVKTSPQVQSEQ